MRTQWEFGHAGDTDMSFIHSRQKIYDRLDRYTGFGPQEDTTSKDMPRKDMLSFIGPTDRKIYIGGGNKNTRKELLLLSKYRLENYFTVSEVKEMGPLYIQAGGHRSGTGGVCSHLISVKHRTHITGQIRTPHIICINPKFIDDSAIGTHELIHAKRYGTRDYVNDADREEKETDLETICRISPSDMEKRSGHGYYQFIPDVRKEYRKDFHAGRELQNKYELEDRKLIIGKKAGMKGRALTQRINKLYPKTHISRTHFSPAEKLDRFFIIKSGGLTIKEHVRYVEATSLEAIKTDYRKTYPDLKMWEIRDGKEVQII